MDLLVYLLVILVEVMVFVLGVWDDLHCLRGLTSYLKLSAFEKESRLKVSEVRWSLIRLGSIFVNDIVFVYFVYYWGLLSKGLNW